ncbi:hypothetical protein BDF14DRAFT_958180 [Spinellus fusiger]|nr:hypothetical protein BDF14DRAFT_958180 [Spinellus fusiger]
MQFNSIPVYNHPSSAMAYAFDNAYLLPTTNHLMAIPEAPLQPMTAMYVKNEKTKRKQVKNACVNCQKACKKCDDGRPCQRCVKLGLTLTCSNSERKERKKGMKRGPYKKRQRQSSYTSQFDQDSCVANEWQPNSLYTPPQVQRREPKQEPTTHWLEDQQHRVYSMSSEESALAHALPMLDTGYVQPMSCTTPSLAQSSPLSSSTSSDEAYNAFAESSSPVSFAFSQRGMEAHHVTSALPTEGWWPQNPAAYLSQHQSALELNDPSLYTLPLDAFNIPMGNTPCTFSFSNNVSAMTKENNNYPTMTQPIYYAPPPSQTSHHHHYQQQPSMKRSAPPMMEDPHFWLNESTTANSKFMDKTPVADPLYNPALWQNFMATRL